MDLGNAKLLNTSAQSAYNPPYPLFIEFAPSFLNILDWSAGPTGTPDPPKRDAALPLWDGRLYVNPAGYSTSTASTSIYSTAWKPGLAVENNYRLNTLSSMVMSFFEVVLDGSNTWQGNYNFITNSGSVRYFNNGTILTQPSGGFTGATDPRIIPWVLTNIAPAFGGSGIVCNQFNTLFRFR